MKLYTVVVAYIEADWYEKIGIWGQTACFWIWVPEHKDWLLDVDEAVKAELEEVYETPIPEYQLLALFEGKIEDLSPKYYTAMDKVKP